jgi:hypothetical protein
MSVNTTILHVFRLLSSCGRSFSVGDLAFPRTALLDSVLPEPHLTWSEHELRIPIDNQCPCEPCRQNSVPKEAIEVRLNGPFVVVRLRPHLSVTPSGLFIAIREALGSDPHTIRGCTNRSHARLPYSHEAYDLETYAMLCKSPQVSLEEFRQYNRVRLGSEFFVPTELMSTPLIV